MIAFTTYTAPDGWSFPVNEDDLVFVYPKGKSPKPTGYNHYRAWSLCWIHATGHARA